MLKKIITAALAAVIIVSAAAYTPLKANAASSTGTGTASIGFSQGVLLLVSVPSFDFGLANSMPSATTTYTAQAVTGNISVLDGRGTAPGWRLTAQLGVFTNALHLGADPIMPTAQLQLPAPAVSPYVGNIAPAPGTVGVANLVPGEASAHPIVSAAAGQGNGGWQGTYTASGVKLLINPDNIVSGSNSALITWTLYDAP